ncbi:MAG: ribosome biogenesis GTPase Der [Alicyclobacillaceae bacterium]|nr:ribosome biogenesis GTPase Der [Alicyclobacillaceae bacterium]
MASRLVAIVGRPNVGKSTLFNRIAGQRIAIVEDKPGVTRDRLYAPASWNGQAFRIIDTGGLDFGNLDSLAQLVRAQAELAVEEAAVIVFVVDGLEGITSTDENIAQLLRRSGKPVILAVNKLDNPERMANRYEFFRIGLGEPLPISAEHGLGIGDLLDAVVDRLPPEQPEEEGEDAIRVAVIGRPNVGKSSLVNRILGEERVLVSEIPGTTRDAIDTPFERDNQSFVLIDTAGMRKRGRIWETTEKYSVLRALRAIDRSDVCLLVLDGREGIAEQDKRVGGYAVDAGRAVIVIVNKWDLVEKDDKTAVRMTERIHNEFAFMNWAPVLFVSAKTGQRVGKILDTVVRVAEQHAMRIPTSTVNQVLEDAVTRVPPPTDKGRRLRIYYASQVGVRPPTFVFFVNDPELMHFSYLRYLENQFRAAFGFEGTPIRLLVRERK